MADLKAAKTAFLRTLRDAGLILPHAGHDEILYSALNEYTEAVVAGVITIVDQPTGLTASEPVQGTEPSGDDPSANWPKGSGPARLPEPEPADAEPVEQSPETQEVHDGE